MSSSPLLPIVPRDPSRIIFELQQARQRFGRGLLATLLLALPYSWVWSRALALGPVGSKRWAVAVLVGAVLLGLPMRVLGRPIELRLALAAGALAVLCYAVASFWARGGGSALPSGPWLQVGGSFFGVFVLATITARESVDIDLSKPSARQRSGLAGLPPPAPHEDPDAIVFEEPANIQRGVITVPGTLVLTRSHLKFTERKLQVAAPVLALADLVEADEGLLSRSFTVKVRDGSSVTFVVMEADKWIVNINLRLG